MIVKAGAHALNDVALPAEDHREHDRPCRRADTKVFARMSGGLPALLDDVAALTKVAAASLDDVAGKAMRAGTKAAGVFIDDAAVAPSFMAGTAAQRELSVVGRIALGSRSDPATVTKRRTSP